MLSFPCPTGKKQVSSFAALESWKESLVQASLASRKGFKPSEGSLLWGRLWRPDIQALVCDVFIKVHILGLKCPLLI